MATAKTVAAVSGAALSWAAAYFFAANAMNNSSSIVRQTLFNINVCTDNGNGIVVPVTLSSRIRGKMNQFKGHADIDFDVCDSVGSKRRVCEL